MILLNLLVIALIIIGFFLIIRLAIRYMLPPGDIQDTVVLIIGIVAVILLLIEIGATIGGRAGLFGTIIK